jgi:hypothetical protein
MFHSGVVFVVVIVIVVGVHERKPSERLSSEWRKD